MEDYGFILIVLLVGILFLFRRSAPGLSLDRLFKHDMDVHNRAHHAIAKHPHGGTWKEMKADMDEEVKE